MPLFSPTADNIQDNYAELGLDRSNLYQLHEVLDALHDNRDFEQAEHIEDNLADRRHLHHFVKTLFRNATAGFVIFTMFVDGEDRGSKKSLYQWPWVAIPATESNRVVEMAVKIASQAARGDTRANFCPPCATFQAEHGTGMIDIEQGLSIMVELDKHPERSRQQLETLIGTPTLVVKSGGKWVNPETGEVEDRSHVYWRLNQPTCTPDEHAALRTARELAARIVEADTTAAPPVHPIRWPGSWHKKAEPRLTVIAESDPDGEVDLEAVLTVLRERAEQMGVEVVEHTTAALERPAYDLSGNAEWDMDKPGPRTIRDRYLRLQADRHYKLSGYAVSIAMSAINAGYDMSVSELADIAEQAQRDNPSGSRYTRPELVKLAADALPSAYRKVPNPAYLRRQEREAYQSARAAEIRAEIDEMDREDEPGDNEPYGDDADEREEHADDPKTSKPVPDDKTGGNLNVWGAKALLQRVIEPRQWLLANIWCRRYLSSVLAEGGTGKTALTVARAVALASGRPITEEHIFQRSRVLYMTLEDDLDELGRRVQACCLYHEIGFDQLDGYLFAATLTHGDKLTVTDRNGTHTGPLRIMLEQAIVEHKLDLIVLDPFIKSHGASENDNQAIDFAAGILTDLAIAYNVAVEAPHHTRKGSSEDHGNSDTGRGASSFKDACRITHTLMRMTETVADYYGVAKVDRWQYIRDDSGKVNLTKPGRDAQWFQLVGVKIGNATSLYPHGDEVQTVRIWSPPDLLPYVGDEDFRNAVLDAIRDAPKDSLYSAEPQAGDRHIWNVMKDMAPQLTKKACETIIQTWITHGYIWGKVEYKDDNGRKKHGLGVGHPSSAQTEKPATIFY